MDSWTSLRLQDQKVYCHVLQDIDAAYIFDDNSDLDASLSALLEVPSLDMAQFDARPVSNATGGNTSGSQLTVGKTSWSLLSFPCEMSKNEDCKREWASNAVSVLEVSEVLSHKRDLLSTHGEGEKPLWIAVKSMSPPCWGSAVGLCADWRRRRFFKHHLRFLINLCAVGNYGAPPPRARGTLDGLVPDMKQQNMKRQRIDN